MQWRDRETCRRCGASLPAPVVKIVERVVERIVFRPYAPSIAKTEGAVEEVGEVGAVNNFPTMAEMERMMILAAYQRSNRRTLEAARLLGIGKTTMYRKLREMKRAA